MNLIKEHVVRVSIPIRKSITIWLTGINEHPVNTLEQVKIEVLEYSTIFNIISNHVPISDDRVQGSEFPTDNDVKINDKNRRLKFLNKKHPFEPNEIIIVPERTISNFFVHIRNLVKKESYIPDLSMENGIYLGNAVVKNDSVKAYLKVANTPPDPI